MEKSLQEGPLDLEQDGSDWAVWALFVAFAIGLFPWMHTSSRLGIKDSGKSTREMLSYSALRGTVNIEEPLRELIPEGSEVNPS